MNFVSAYQEKDTIFTPCGAEERPTYGYKINKNGVKILEQTGKENIYEKIQEYLEETKIENVLARCVAGDTSMLRPDGVYADVSNMPRNLIEAKQQINELENLWSGLPLETRELYNHNVEEFIGDSGSDKWLKAMGLTGVNMVEADNSMQSDKMVQAHGEVSKESEATT